MAFPVALRIVRRLLAGMNRPPRLRLWDDVLHDLGHDSEVTLVIRDRETFRETFGSKNTKVMAEAFIDDRIDCDGDLFAALRVANQLEDLRLGWLNKIQIYMELRGV